MATPGPAPSARTTGRTDVADWVEVEDKPFAEGLDRSCPIAERDAEPPTEDNPLGREPAPHPSTVRWWEAIRVMPHAVLWTETDWIFAEDTAVLKERFYTGDLSDTAHAEMRRREDQMGTTVEARRKIRIRYIPTKVRPVTTAAPASTSTTPSGVPNIADRRARLAGH